MLPHKHLALAAVTLLLVSCAVRSSQSKYSPRLTRAQAIRIASTIRYPMGYDSHQYAFKGSAIFYPPLRQWGVTYDLTSPGPVSFGSGYFAVWIDDATGEFDHYSFDH